MPGPQCGLQDRVAHDSHCCTHVGKREETGGMLPCQASPLLLPGRMLVASGWFRRETSFEPTCHHDTAQLGQRQALPLPPSPTVRTVASRRAHRGEKLYPGREMIPQGPESGFRQWRRLEDNAGYRTGRSHFYTKGRHRTACTDKCTAAIEYVPYNLWLVHCLIHLNRAPS